MGVIELNEITHMKRNCLPDDEKEIASVTKPDGTQFVKMMCENCGKFWLDVSQLDSVEVGLPE